MARRIFYSFHFANDYWRTSQVRNIGVVEDNAPVSDNDWEAVKKKGDQAIKNWINDQLKGRSCTIVLVGAKTAGRKWINYEIRRSWNEGKGVVGIYIHRLKNRNGYQSQKGNNPFASFTMDRDQKKLSSIVKCYNPNTTSSKTAYGIIANNISNWAEEAIKIRDNY
ncbi:MAG: TIR domain-containing protein [Proteobacteria bacterium]|nr:TIR domain-containing protein [Pseudomonadota bacterium]